MADRLIDPPFGTTSSASDPIIDLILSCNTQKTTDGRERREAEKELEMQEKKKLIGSENLMSLRTHLASNGDGRENAIVELPECREYLEFATKGFC